MKLFKTDRIVPAVTISLIVVFSFMLYADFTRKFTRSRAAEIGVLTHRKRMAERRFADEVLWENIDRNAKVYNCDYLMTPEDSGAVVRLKDNSNIEIGENTLILVCLSDRGVQINLDRGSVAARRTAGARELNITSGKASIQMKKGVVSVDKSKEDVNLAVSEGNVDLTVEGRKDRIDPGKTALVAGSKVTIEKVAVRQVSPEINRYFVTAGKEQAVGFTWEPEGPQQVTLEVAKDNAFTAPAGRAVSAGTGAVISLPVGSYYWRLKDGRGKAGPARAFTVVADHPVQQLAPVSGQQFSYKDKKPFVYFKWKESEAASSYAVDISRDPSFKELALTLDSDSGSIATDALAAGTYYWRVRNVYGFNPDASLQSQSRQFVVTRAADLQAPEQLLPGEGERSSDLSLSSGGAIFNWKESGDYTGYDFIIARDREFRNVVYRKRTAVNFHKPEITLAKGTYYWAVSGMTAAGASSLRSSPRAFTVVAASPPALLVPEPGMAVNSVGSREIAFKWSGTNGGQRYRFELSRERDFRKPLQSAVVSGTSHTVAMPAPGNYFWRVAALNAGGAAALASEVRGFSVTAALGVPAGIYPVNNEAVSVDAANGLAFKWKEVEGATRYLFRLKHVAAAGEKVLVTARVKTTRYAFKRIELLDAGSFAWEVSAVMEKGGVVTAQGKPETYYFIIKPGKQLEAPKLKSDVIYVE